MQLHCGFVVKTLIFVGIGICNEICMLNQSLALVFAFGSKFMSSTYIMLNYKKERIIDRFGLQAGLSLIHYSNANVKAPNTSINSLTFKILIYH